MEQYEFDEYICLISKQKLNKSLREFVSTLLAAHGFERWIYAAENPCGILGVPITLANGFGKWMLNYMLKGYQDIDPILSHCRISTEPLLWDATVGWETASERVKAMMADVAVYGFGSGVAIPLRGPVERPYGILNVTSPYPLSVSRAHFQNALPRLVNVAQAMHGVMINISKNYG